MNNCRIVAVAALAVGCAHSAFAALTVTDLKPEVGIACEVVTEDPCMGAGWKLRDAAGREFSGFGAQRHAGEHFVFRVPEAAVGPAEFSVRMEDGEGGPWVTDGRDADWVRLQVNCRAKGVAPAVTAGCARDTAAPVIRQGKLGGWIRGDRTEFALGEKAVFCFEVPTNATKVVLRRFGDDLVDEQYVVDAVPATGLVLESTMTKPGVLSVELKCSAGMMTLSAIFALDDIRGAMAGRPADFDEYWASLRSQAQMSVAQAKVESWAQGKDGFTVTIPCGAKMPMTAGYSVRADAAPKSCTAYLSFPGYNATQAAGVPTAMKGKILLDFNPHGTPIGMKPDFYQQFAATNRLQNYGFERELNESRETSYFHDMALRLLTALEFVKTLPQWNGRIEVEGASQGGYLSLLAASLEPSVKRVKAMMPWLCDFDSDIRGYRGGWHPYYTEAMAYYFPLYHLQNLRAEHVTLTAGLADTTCTPYGIIAVYNALKCPKALQVYQGAWHCGSSLNAKLDVNREAK